MASRAASANSTVVAYRWSGSLAMPVAMTSSTCGGTFGWLIEGRGGGVLRCAATSCAHGVAGKGRAAGQAFVEHAGQRVDVGAGVLIGSDG